MATNPAPDAITITGLTVRYGENTALERIDYALAAGELCGLIGVNGSGKSTLFKSIMGLQPPSSGSVRLFGHSPAAARKLGLLGYVPQAEAVDWTFPVSVREVVMMGRYGYMGRTRRPGHADKAAVAEALERVDLMDLAHRQIGELSGGQKKRAFVARGIAQGAKLMLLDEPFAGVDIGSEQLITDQLRALNRAGTTILISTHDLAQVPRLCSSALLLHRRLLASGPPDEVLTDANLALTFGHAPRETR